MSKLKRWKVDTIGGKVVIVTEKNELIVEVGELTIENCYNARLMAVAPEMLEVLENSLTDTDDDHAREVVQNAINKAKGGE